jgi:DNA (cytosine-5)-methyltransferase 1
VEKAQNNSRERGDLYLVHSNAMGLVPVIDLFAGPGGLGEGFSSYEKGRNSDRFSVCLSIEKDPTAHRTLLLRSFFRQLERFRGAYYQRVRGEISTEELFQQFPSAASAASKEAVCLELGPKTRKRTDELVVKAIGKAEKWVLIGGPPCQAYSLVGRSRMKGADEVAYERDGRHFLYREYLRILHRFKPPVFVMENVKGLLSSTVLGRRIFREIMRDLRAAGYSLHSFVRYDREVDLDPSDYVIRSEDYDIPQTRHRVILLGVRTGLQRGTAVLQPQLVRVPVDDAIGDLPPLRSTISKDRLNGREWDSIVAATSAIRMDDSLASELKRQLSRRAPQTSGAEFFQALTERRSPWLTAHGPWFLDDRIGGVVHHSARSHMPEDLQRYFFAACFARVHGRSPKLGEFPKSLWPEHRNVRAAVDGKMFSDRFRVQAEGRPATTVVSHISKDGHYFIHYDPRQCRSLTVREAARLQTFPDNYFFEGSRTEQYHQVGNAVPPLLGRQLAEVVANVLSQLG